MPAPRPAALRRATGSSFLLPPRGCLAPLCALLLACLHHARLCPRRREIQHRVLEQLHQAEHRRGLVRVQRLGARDQLRLVVGVVELGEVLAARLIQYEFNAKLGHGTSSLLGDNSRLPCAQSRSPSRAGPRFCSRWTGPSPRRKTAKSSSRSRPRASIGPTSCSAAETTRFRPMTPISPGWKSPVKWFPREKPSRSATRCALWCTAAATPNSASRPKCRRCRCRKGCRSSRPLRCPRPSSPSGATPSIAAGSSPARRCSSRACLLYTSDAADVRSSVD